MLKNCLFAFLCIYSVHTRAALPKPASFSFNHLLPVADVIQLDGLLANGKVMIHWLTKADTAGGFFVVQKSADGASWQEWQRINADGRHDYRTTDEGLHAGNCWYRIVLTDAAGSNTTSTPLWIPGTKKLVTITIIRSTQTLSLIWWGPAPVTADVQLFYFNGQPVKNYGTISLSGNHSLPLTDLLPGRYILKFAAGPVVESLSFQY